MRTTKLVTAACRTALFTLGVFALASQTQAGKPWHSVAANLNWQGECSTSAVASSNPNTPGGRSCFNKTVFIPGSANVLRITWSTTGDAHSGTALRLSCVITDGAGTTSFCQTGVGSDGAPAGWLTALILPNSANTNCRGPGDCHDNSMHYAWCVQIPGDDVYTIDLRLASKNGGNVFTEKSTFYIDSTKLHDDNCVQQSP